MALILIALGTKYGVCWLFLSIFKYDFSEYFSASFEENSIVLNIYVCIAEFSCTSVVALSNNKTLSACLQILDGESSATKVLQMKNTTKLNSAMRFLNSKKNLQAGKLPAGFPSTFHTQLEKTVEKFQKWATGDHFFINTYSDHFECSGGDLPTEFHSIQGMVPHRL